MADKKWFLESDREFKNLLTGQILIGEIEILSKEVLLLGREN